jgi:integrase
MKRQHLVLRPCNQGPYRWVIDGAKENGKRKRFFFRTKSVGETELGRLKLKLAREGARALELSDQLRIDALRAQEELGRYGKSLGDAIEFYLAHLRATQKHITFKALMDEYLESRKRLGRTENHRKDMRLRLKRVAETFGERPVRGITMNELEDWLHSLKLKPKTVNNFRSRLNVLLNYGVKRGYLENNPAADIEKITDIGEPVGIFTPEAIETLLAAANGHLRAALVLQAFCGLRVSETLRLHWENVRLERRHVLVPARKSKTAQRRLVTISHNLAEWLVPYLDRSPDAKVWPEAYHHYFIAIAKLSSKTGVRWVPNGLRHSFASYHLAKHNNANLLALQLGHTTTELIFSNYSEVVTPEEAERYWQIRPSQGASNIVPLKLPEAGVG